MKHAILVILMVGTLFNCARTPATYRKIDTGITSLEKLQVNGDEQVILLRGKNTEDPIVLFLHGGPGMPMMYLAHTFQEELEQHFIVAHWDQRASGKSWHTEQDTSSINIRQYLDDAYVVISHLQERFDKKKIFLVGHSFGSYLGTLLIREKPEWFHAYIGIGQVVDDKKALTIQADFLNKEATKRKDTKALSELDHYGWRIHEKYLFKYGGELKHHTGYWPFIRDGLMSKEYTFRDAMNLSRASNFCSRHMQYNVIEGSILEAGIDTFQLPVYYFVGVSDYTTPFTLIEAYYAQVKAPRKALVWFHSSAHFPHYEEPDEFVNQMILIKQSTFLENQ